MKEKFEFVGGLFVFALFLLMAKFISLFMTKEQRTGLTDSLEPDYHFITRIY